MQDWSSFNMENSSPSIPEPPSANAERFDAPPELVTEMLRFEPKPRRLGEILVDLAMASAEAVERALEEQRTEARLLGEILVLHGICKPEQISKALEVQAVLSSPLWQNLGAFRWKEGVAFTHVQETHRHAVVVSVGDRHVQLSPEEHILAEGLVSESTFGDIARRFWERTGQLVWPEQLIALTTRLWMLGLLSMDRGPAHADDPVPKPPSPRPNGWAHWLQVRVPLHDPSRLLDLSEPAGRFFFSRSGFACIASLIVLALAILSMHAGTLGTLILGNLGHRWVGGIGSFLLAYLLCSTVHEYGHAMACRAFGGKVQRMGVMLYLFFPMAYCDVSDAHRFPEKWKRLVVSAAGIYFQLMLAALAGLAWAWLSLPEAAELVLAQMVAITAISTLANLNPLLKFDGYYMLADWLEIPNLRPRAFAMIDGLAKGLPASGDLRERRAFLWYGLLGGAYTVAIAGYLTWRLAHLLLRSAGLS
ncbi:Peptidase family M50 [compost metagenome]